MDNYVLYGRGGASPINLGTYLNTGEGQPDFDFGNVFRARFAENAAADDAALGFISSGKRAFKFPLLLSAAAPSGLDLLTSILRRHVSGGGYIDLQPLGTPSAAAVRFDVLGGQLREDYSTHLQRVNRRRATLELGVRPFGYWPTEILLASAHWATGPLQLTWDPASVIGDAPGPARLVVAPTTLFAGEIVASVPNMAMDGFAWSLSRPSGATLLLLPSAFQAATDANSFAGGSNPLFSATVLTGDPFAPRGDVRRIGFSASLGRWAQVARYAMSTSAAQVYGGGRYRLFAYARTTPSWSSPLEVAGDVVSVPSIVDWYAFMASHAPVATLLPQANASFGDTNGASGPFQILDLGEFSIPAAASGFDTTTFVRLWMKPATSNIGVATPHLDLGGVYLQPVHGPAGVLPFGIIYPSWSNIIATTGFGTSEVHSALGKVVLDGISGRAMRTTLGAASPGHPDVNDSQLVRPLDGVHRGALPHVTSSSGSLDLMLIGHRYAKAGASAAFYHGGQHHMQAVSLKYRPRFAFLRGL